MHNTGLEEEESPTFNSGLLQNNNHEQEEPQRQPLPNFQVSNVIAKNEPIEVPQIEERPLQHFFNRMNELGYEANNVSQTFLMQGSNYMGQEGEKRKQQQAASQQKYNQNFDNNSSNAPRLESRFAIDHRFRSQIKKRVDKIDIAISNLTFEKMNIIDCLKEYQLKVSEMVRDAVSKIQQKIEQSTEESRNRTVAVERELQIYIRKCKALEVDKQLDDFHSIHLSSNMCELDETNKQLICHIEQLQAENNELKYQLGKEQNNQKAIQQLEEEIAALNQTIDQNSEYIFDLEQRVAGAGLELEEKEASVKKKYEAIMEEEREKIQNEYKEEFQKIQEEIQKRIEEQLEEEYQTSLLKLQETHRVQVEEAKSLIEEEIKNRYEQQIKQFEADSIRLVKTNKEYECKLHEYEQQQQRSQGKHNNFLELSRELDSSRLNESIERQLKQKENQLNYYKSLAAKPDYPFTYSVKQPNILVIDHNTSNTSMQREAISPSSSLAALYNRNIASSSRDQKINTILSRIRLRQNGSILSNLNDVSMESVGMRKGVNQSIFRPVSPQSVILEREKDVRMRNISQKLQQLRSDIRRQIGMINH